MFSRHVQAIKPRLSECALLAFALCMCSLAMRKLSNHVCLSVPSSPLLCTCAVSWYTERKRSLLETVSSIWQ